MHRARQVTIRESFFCWLTAYWCLTGVLLADISGNLERPGQYFAAKELRRYLYLTTGQLGRITADVPRAPGDHFRLEIDDRLGAEEYDIATAGGAGNLRVRIAGGSEAAILYGVYAYVEKLGVWFSLSGDEIPRKPLEAPPRVNVRENPAISVRGVQLFADFPEGIDWWGETEYLAYIAQLPKLRLNFLGIHTYGEEMPAAEPTVWIGKRESVARDGSVALAYPASYHSSLRGQWGYRPMRTSEYHLGADRLFEADDYGVWNAGAETEVFNRVARNLRQGFGLARRLGVKTAVGTDTPLSVPRAVKARFGPGLSTEELYEGIFDRITKAYPIDYYSLWTTEGWTGAGTDAKHVEDTLADVKTAENAWAKLGRPFHMSVLGWRSGPPQDPQRLDRELRPETILGSLNRNMGLMTVDPVYRDFQHTNRWGITWLQDDDALTLPPLWVGRARMDAAEAYQAGLSGMLAIHWHTKWASPGASAFAKSLWDLPFLRQSREGAIGGDCFKFKEPVGGTTNAILYQTQRLNTYGYRLSVPAGTYNVTLQFCEMQVKGTNQRVFGITLQDQRVCEQLDIFKEAGYGMALDKGYSNVVVGNKELKIGLVPRLGIPCVCGIVVSSPGKRYVRKINCAGPPCGDYEADAENYAPARDFYHEWARALFGAAEAENIATLFSYLDGRLPRLTRWITGPGGFAPDYEDWGKKQAVYDFIESLQEIQKRLKEPYARRLDYWIHAFQYFRDVARLRCLWGALDRCLADYRKEHAPPALASALEWRRQMAGQITAIYGDLFALLSTTGELGTLANWEQNVLPLLWEQPGMELSRLRNEALPQALELGHAYHGPPRIVVPSRPTIGIEGRPVRLKVWILAEQPVEKVELFWKLLGAKGYHQETGQWLNRGVYQVVFPTAAGGLRGDLEYYLSIKIAGESARIFPPEAKTEIIDGKIVKQNLTLVSVPPELAP